MSEKYWVFQNNQVVGPFGVEDLLERSGFSGETLVCSEGRQGTDAGDWQRADLVTHIAEALSRPKSPHFQPTAAKQSVSSSESLADSVVIKEMTLLGAVHEKIGALGQSVLQIQETLSGNGKEMATLRSSVEEKTRQVEELALQVRAFDGIGASLAAFKEKLQTLSEFQSRQATLEELSRSQHRSIEEINQKIDFLSQAKETDSGLGEKLAQFNKRLDDLEAKNNLAQQSIGADSDLSAVKETMGE